MSLHKYLLLAGLDNILMSYDLIYTDGQTLTDYVAAFIIVLQCIEATN